MSTVYAVWFLYYYNIIRLTPLPEDYYSGTVLNAIAHIQQRMWGTLPRQLNAEFKEHIHKFRAFLPKCVLKSQLYSLLVDRQSHVDYELDQLVSKGKIRRLITHNNELVILTDDYVNTINDQIVAHARDDEEVDMLQSLRDFVSTSSDSLISKDAAPLTPQQITTLIGMGYFSLIPLDVDHLYWAIPRMGFVVQLEQKSQKFILQCIKRTKHKEIALTLLREKWMKNKLRFKEYKGVSLTWCLHCLIGNGIVEVFQSTDDRAIRLV